ncbi:hypothetical protein HHI36_007354 [Cryptolaemus montrouzieri]|uniref:Anillin homology domain-containing protein n=1 Tax=Cryptolaemus montrouzieri TaxID=559131 RepID=A0ABD2MPF5_9CUCU
MQCFKSSAIPPARLMTPVKSSVRYISRGGNKVWGSITGKRTSISRIVVSEPQNQLNQSLSSELADASNIDSVSLQSGVSVSKSTDQKHYTCLSPYELQRISTKPNGAQITMACEEYPSKSSTPTDMVETIFPSLKTEEKLAETDGVNASELKCAIKELNAIKGNPNLDQSGLEDFYDEIDKMSPVIIDEDRRKNLIKQKFVVSLCETPNEVSATSSTICKYEYRRESSDSLSRRPLSLNSSTKENLLHENFPLIPPTSCGNKDDSQTSSRGSFGSNSSISDLISEDEEEDEDVFVEPEGQEVVTLKYLKNEWNQECFKIKGLSKALSLLRGRNEKKMTEAYLQAEKQLLLSTLRCRVYSDKISNFKSPPRPTTTGTVTISRIRIPIKPTVTNFSSNTYFVCVAASKFTILGSKYVQALGREGRQYLLFDEKMVFEGLEKDFKIYVKIYFVQLNDRNRGYGILPRKSVAYPVKMYQYDNLLTTTTEEEYFLLPSFKQCGIFELSLKNFENNHLFNFFPDSPLYYKGFAKRTMTNLKMMVRMDGLLNFGQRLGKDDVIIWNIKYVVLEETEVRIYNCPTDEDPIVKLDLKNVASEIVTHTCHLKHCLQIDIVYDEDPDFAYAFKFPYFLRANTPSEFKIWSSKLNHVINKLKQWNLLRFIHKQIDY